MPHNFWWLSTAKISGNNIGLNTELRQKYANVLGVRSSQKSPGFLTNDKQIKNVKYITVHYSFVKTIKIAAFLILLVAIFVMIGGYMNVFACSLMNYTCVFSLLLKMAGLTAALYIGYRLFLL